MVNNKVSSFDNSLIFGRGRTVKTLKQSGKQPDIVRDQGRRALLPGKRISKSGKVYWETRKNRSDNQGSRV